MTTTTFPRIPAFRHGFDSFAERLDVAARLSRAHRALFAPEVDEYRLRRELRPLNRATLRDIGMLR